MTSATNSITVAIGNNPGAGTLAGTLTVAAANGVATFPNLSINNTGVGYTLTASATGFTTVTSTAFSNVALGVPAKLAFTVQPSNVAAGEFHYSVRYCDCRRRRGQSGKYGDQFDHHRHRQQPIERNAQRHADRCCRGWRGDVPTLNINIAGSGYTLTATATGLTAPPAGPLT